MILVRTPLRISFFGGGTDLPEFYREHGGAVLSMAIDKYIYVGLKQRWDNLIYLHYTKNEVVDNVDDLKHDLVREAMKWCGVDGGLEIVTLADIPSEGTGLGSSSSLTVGLLHAMCTHNDIEVGPDSLACAAAVVEVDRAGKGVGHQDHYIAAFGGLRFITFPKMGLPVAENVLSQNINALARNLMLFYTGITRQAINILEEQRQNILKSIDLLIHLRSMAHTGRDLLFGGYLDGFGQLLHEAWSAKKQLAKGISNDAIDGMYRDACQAGALGGKLCGAGGGGFLLLYCPEQSQVNVRRVLSKLRELPFNFEPEGSKILVNANQSVDRTPEVVWGR